MNPPFFDPSKNRRRGRFMDRFELTLLRAPQAFMLPSIFLIIYLATSDQPVVALVAVFTSLLAFISGAACMDEYGQRQR